ncbi:uncharacterized protein DEA37_0000888 [Paragonimus westermani]|uniref:Integrase catalytic domain-containing protein n=1 Tax=Paragonimus westermani TaxID=34504 RepID=A0A5J4NJ30_9TREM|nr:uncharacterized protein DEA37_0000888 [Paragonimus westermani]
MFWHGIDQDIESTVRSCESCALAAKAPPRVNTIPWPEPKGPWARIHIDFARPLKGEYYFVVVDAYSKWPEVIPMSLASTSTTVTALGQLFSQFGVPESIVSDNGPQFTSMAFVNFCKAMGTELIHTPVYHPRSNGHVERFVDTFKRALFRNCKGKELSRTCALIDQLLTPPVRRGNHQQKPSWVDELEHP